MEHDSDGSEDADHNDDEDENDEDGEPEQDEEENQVPQVLPQTCDLKQIETASEEGDAASDTPPSPSPFRQAGDGRGRPAVAKPLHPGRTRKKKTAGLLGLDHTQMAVAKAFLKTSKLIENRLGSPKKSAAIRFNQLAREKPKWPHHAVFILLLQSRKQRS